MSFLLVSDVSRNLELQNGMLRVCLLCPTFNLTSTKHADSCEEQYFVAWDLVYTAWMFPTYGTQFLKTRESVTSMDAPQKMLVRKRQQVEISTYVNMLWTQRIA